MDRPHLATALELRHLHVAYGSPRRSQRLDRLWALVVRLTRSGERR